MFKRAHAIFILLFSFAAYSAPANMGAEALGAKAFLEDLLARRFAQELATKVDREAFSVGAQLDVTELPKKNVTIEKMNQPPEPISDLMLGTLDPEELMKKYAGSDIKPSAEGFLRNYRIKTVNVSVGLKEEIEPEFKAEVEKWLTARVTQEFGKAGKGTVAFIKSAPLKKEITPKKDLLGWLNDFQALAGQIVMALAILFSVLMWKVLTSKANVNKTGEAGTTVNVGGGEAGTAAAAKKAQEAEIKLKEEEERQSAARDIAQLTDRLNALIPDYQKTLRTSCALGAKWAMK